MIIWNGLGFLVAVIVFGCVLAANLVANAMTGSGTYWDENRWTLGVALPHGLLGADSRRRRPVLARPGSRHVTRW